MDELARTTLNHKFWKMLSETEKPQNADFISNYYIQKTISSIRMPRKKKTYVGRTIATDIKPERIDRIRSVNILYTNLVR